MELVNATQLYYVASGIKLIYLKDRPISFILYTLLYYWYINNRQIQVPL